MSKVEIKNITKDYGNHKGVFNVSLNISTGEAFGFLGPNGAGKSTTLRTLMGFIKPDDGISLINNLDCFKKREVIQKSLGYIPGEISFMNDMSGIEFIKFLANYRGIKDLTKAYELINLFELDPKTKIKKMSKGTKQKIGIVVALMHDPEIIILDEPTSGLDPLMQNKFINLIRSEKEKGKTILISSHMFEEIEKTCDKVAIIKNGNIVATDSIANLKKSKSKKFILTFKNKKDIINFKKEKIDIEDINEDKVTVIIKNNFKEFFKLLNTYDISDLDEETLGLEEVFMDYYGGDLK